MFCVSIVHVWLYFFFFKQKTAYEMRISDWSSDVCSSDLLGSPIEQRAALLADWENAPAARLAHPREDHLIPLMVAAGAAEDEAAACVYHETLAFANITASRFRFGTTA